MKRNYFFILLMILINLSCNDQRSFTPDGSWQLVYAKYDWDGSVIYEYPVNISGDCMKIWSGNHFTSIGLLDFDTSIVNVYVGGKYKIESNRYEENIFYHTNTNAVGQKVKMLMELKNDTLVQTWPVNDMGQINEKRFHVEKYVRME
jgi:hypothetical protein